MSQEISAQIYALGMSYNWQETLTQTCTSAAGIMILAFPYKLPSFLDREKNVVGHQGSDLVTYQLNYSFFSAQNLLIKN